MTVALPDRPRSVSARGHLRDGVPAVYRDGDFAMRLLTALEEVLDPVVCLLDNLHWHLDPQLAPADLLELIATWLGLELEDIPTVAQRREAVRRAPELACTRGTARGVQLVLDLTFPDLGLRVHDGGGASWSTEPEHPAPGLPAFDVECPVVVEADVRARLERVIARAKPAHVAHRVVTPEAAVVETA